MSGDWHIYDTTANVGLGGKAVQIRHLAAIGVAASETPYNIRDYRMCFISLFEVIARLAHEIEEEIEP